MDIERTMQFILDAQARLQATASQHDEHLAKLETSVSTLTDLVGRLAQAEIRLVERMDRLTERMDRLAESQAHTDQRLDVLIDVVDKIVRRNGSPG
jgi:peptidoglycan hydrolase CwlO-like protein